MIGMLSNLLVMLSFKSVGIFFSKLQIASIKNKHVSGSLGLDEEDGILLAVFHSPAVQSRLYFSSVLSG